MKKPLFIVSLVAGSHLYGTNVVGSDRDVRGIFIETPRQMFCTRNDDAQQTVAKGGEDTVYHSLKKFHRLAIDNNPSILEMLFTPNHFVIGASSVYWNQLRRNRFDYLSQSTIKTYGGFLTAQIKRSDIVDGTPERRTTNNKAMMHAYRLLLSFELMVTDPHLFSPVIPSEDIGTLLDIRAGRFERDKLIRQLLRRLEVAENKAREILPKEIVNKEKLDDTVTTMYLTAYKGD